MKYVFLACLLALLTASGLTYLSLPNVRNEVPVIYWVTDSNPARIEQIRLFHKWLIKNGHFVEKQFQTPDEARAFLRQRVSKVLQAIVAEDYGGDDPARRDRMVRLIESGEAEGIEFPLTIRIPSAEMKLDTANTDQSKKIIQGVSGVGGDVQDQWSGGGIRLFDSMALLRDLTDDAQRLGFGPDATYQTLVPELTIEKPEGPRQYGFPCNVVASMYIVNKEAFAAYGVPLPPRQWTIEEFEEIGRQFVKAANPPGERQRVFFIDQIPLSVIRRSLGGNELNETGTACVLDSPAAIRALELNYKWTYVDHLLPTAAERAGFATDSGYGGQTPQMFNDGKYALNWTGRYLLIQYRNFNITRAQQGRPPMQLTVTEAPHGGFRNTNMGTRAASVYAGSRHTELAVLFMAYLASEDYNMQIVRDADSLPPNPKYTRGPEYERPEKNPDMGIYPETEWELHKPFSEVAEQLAVATSYSPFIQQTTFDRYNNREIDLFMNGRATAAEAAATAARRINEEIVRTARESRRLSELYDKLTALQKQIDEKRARGEKVPLSWIKDPFWKRYYVAQGWAEVDQ